MSRAEEYIARSRQLSAEAEAATDPLRRAELEWLANSYRLLAAHAHDDSDLIHPMPQSFSPQQQQPHQIQQGKLEPDEK